MHNFWLLYPTTWVQEQQREILHTYITDACLQLK